MNEVFIDLCRQIIRKDIQGSSSSTKHEESAARKREGHSARNDRRRHRKRDGNRPGRDCVML